MATEGAVASVRINGVSVLKGLCWQLESMRVSLKGQDGNGRQLETFGPTFSS